MEKEGYEKVGEKQKLIGSRGKGEKMKNKKGEKGERRGNGKKQE